MLNLFTDTHLGAEPRTNTSSSSGKQLGAKINEVAIALAHQYGGEGNKLIHVGDLFHRSHNKESVIAKGIEVASLCDILIGGNHDDTNRADDQSSMDLITPICDSVLTAPTGEVQIHYALEFSSGEVVTAIPHHSSQELFDKAVAQACAGDMKDLVLLHCNFNNPFVEDIDAALNLTPEQAESLLRHYRYIVIGHEHPHRWEMGGRLLALGNTHPTSFSDISNKYVWHYDRTKENPWSRTKIWDMEENYLQLDAAEIYNLPESEFVIEEGVKAPEFVDITGNLDAEFMPELAGRIAMIWEKWKPYMVRNQVNAITEDTQSLMEEGYHIEDFSKKIRDGLAEAPEMLKLFNEKMVTVGGE